MTKQSLSLLWRSLLGGTAFAAFCVFSPAAQAQDGWDDEEETDVVEDVIAEVNWQDSDRKKEMEAKMDEQIRQHRNLYFSQLTPEVTSRQIENMVRRRIKDPQLGDFAILRLPGINLDWKNFNKVPPRALPDIVDDVREQAEANAEEKIRPEEQKVAIRANAEERYRMVNKNERVTLTLRGGRGASAEIINQPFRNVNDEYVQLGNRQIIKEDLSREDQARFYKDINEVEKEAYIVNNCGKVDVEYDSLVDQYIFENTATEFRRNFYVPDISKPTASLRTAKPEFWVPMKNFVEKVRNTLVDRLVEQYKANELPQWMTEQGYFLVDKEGGAPGEKEWVDQIEKTRREMPAPTPNDPNGMNGMNGMPGAYGPGMTPMGPSAMPNTPRR